MWDDPEFEKTVNGIIAEECANNGDKAKVVYMLSREAETVELCVKKSALGIDEMIFF